VKPLIKICGVTIAADALAVASTGAHFIGLNLWPGSKRKLSVEHAAKLAATVRTSSYQIKLVGIFVDAPVDTIASAAEAIGLDVVQLHGDEPPELCKALAGKTRARVWKGIAVKGIADITDLAKYPVDAVLLDAASPEKGGTGKTFDWALARRAVVADPQRKVVLAGGLTAENVAAAVAAVSPWAIDVASGVEASPGIKDHAKVRAFVSAARA
jgi:phosphoribosylanthranilate isomerase